MLSIPENLSQIVGKGILFLFLLLPSAEISTLSAQDSPVTDALHYELDIEFDLDSTSIKGTVDFTFRILQMADTMRLDLDHRLTCSSVALGDSLLAFNQVGDKISFALPAQWQPGEIRTVTIAYHGTPQKARMPPWDGGLVKSRDKNGKPLLAVACEGEGAHIWWPCKDDLSDEPDSGVTMHYTVPDTLQAIGNGRLTDIEELENGRKRFSWRVVNPINLYNVTFYIGDYAHIHDRYAGIRGDTLDLDYYVYRYNKEKAKKYFAREVPPMLKAFEHYFGHYPFYEDGYKLVESAYLGMEHQSAIAYGNHYLPGYLGYDPTGMGWDYIVVHESGHEWFGNSISARSLAEIWIHESFTTYSEALYVEYRSDYEHAVQYLISQRPRIENKHPIVATDDKNADHFDGTDQYYKGSWMLHSIRNIVNDSTRWFALLREMNVDFYHRVTNTEEILQWMDARIDYPIVPVMRQYLYHAQPPVLEVKEEESGTLLRWNAEEPDFRMPIRYRRGGEWHRMDLWTEWVKLESENEEEALEFDTKSFYFFVRVLK